jgi:6-phosphogluconolactonase
VARGPRQDGGGGRKIGPALANKEDLGIPWWIYVGTPEGIHLFRMRTSDDPNIPEFVTMTALGLVAETPDPTFLLVDRRRLFCVNQSAATVSAFSADPATGKLTALGQRPSGGPHPCHLALHREGRHLLVATDEGAAVLAVGRDGRPGDATDLAPHPQARGVAFSPDGRFAFVCEARLATHRFDAGKLAPQETTAVKARHLVFRPDGRFAYAVDERASTVTALAYDPKAGHLQPLQTLSTLPGYYDGPNRAAELAVHPNGKYLYASNCGHNSVVMFSIDNAKGTLTYVEDQSTYGTMPVHFGLDTPGKHFAVANQQSGSILILRAPESGRVKPGGNVVPIPAPSCAVFLSPRAT